VGPPLRDAGPCRPGAADEQAGGGARAGGDAAHGGGRPGPPPRGPRAAPGPRPGAGAAPPPPPPPPPPAPPRRAPPPRGVTRPRRAAARPSGPPAEGPPAVVAPARLAALGYLPAGTSVLVGAHVAELRASPAGRELLEMPVKVAGREVRLGSLAGWVGLKLEEIDHLVLGVKADDPFPPPGLLVARTRAPYDAGEVRRALGAERAPGGGKKRLYKVEPPGMRMPLVLWLADERTLVLGLVADHLGEVPETPAEGVEHLPEGVRL